jgi:hypothetical protein
MIKCIYDGLISLWLVVVIRRGQIRWVGRVFQNFKVKICQFLMRNGRLVRSSIVWNKQRFLSKAKIYEHRYVARVNLTNTRVLIYYKESAGLTRRIRLTCEVETESAPRDDLYQRRISPPSSGARRQHQYPIASCLDSSPRHLIRILWRISSRHR